MCPYQKNVCCDSLLEPYWKDGYTCNEESQHTAYRGLPEITAVFMNTMKFSVPKRELEILEISPYDTNAPA